MAKRTGDELSRNGKPERIPRRICGVVFGELGCLSYRGN